MLLVAAMAQAAAPAQSQASDPLLSPRAVLDQYRLTCHNQKQKTAGLMLDKLDLASVSEHAEQWKKVVRQLRVGMMPPAGLPRPNAATYEALTIALENELDRAATAHPHLPAAGVHRVNRTEYGLDIDAAAYLPADDSSDGFDKVVSGLGVSPTLVEGDVDAAPKISRLALGSSSARPPGRFFDPHLRPYDAADGGFWLGWADGMLREYSEHQALEVVKLLLDLGSDINAANDHGITQWRRGGPPVRRAGRVLGR
jgi:hypothetical protein